MTDLVVLGAGGHGKVVADILLALGEPVAGFVDDGRPIGSNVLDLPVLGPLEWLATRACRVELGIGDNPTRAWLARRCLELGCEIVVAIHPRAVVAGSARVERGAVVMAGAIVNPSAVIGQGAIVNTGAVIEHDCVLGEFSHVSPNAALGGGCVVGELAHVGIGATMLPLTSVGARTIVGGGALVACDLPEGVIAVGVPARVRRTVS
jgi:sugar O-acyltransferase (sialic acid O-acetyltransferase NeuD family)